MGPFLKRLLGVFSRSRANENTTEIHLGAFGKHPGWDDHIEDLGLDSSRLVAIKQSLYVKGIGGNIDSGAWDELDPDERIEGFKHIFLGHVHDGVVVGRMWSSRDARGRTRYPMVVCAHCKGLSLECIFQEVLPRVKAVEKRCVATDSADDVRAIIEEGGQELRKLVQDVRPVPEKLVPSLCSLAELAERPELGPSHLGLHRILYHIGRKMQAYSSRGGGSKTTSVRSWRAEPLRVPPCGDSPAESLTLWLRFLLGEFGPTVPLLLILPLTGPWVDIIVGDAGVQQFFCVRSKQIPLTTEIPYSLDDDFIAQREQEIEASRSQAAV